jgi:hypothetical protein
MLNNTRGCRTVIISGNANNEAVSFNGTFMQCWDVEVIDFSKFYLKGSNFTNTFYNARKLREIKGMFDFSEKPSVGNIFLTTPALEELRIKEKTLHGSMTLSSSPLLSDASIQSIIDGLADLADQTSQKVSFHSTVLAKLTDGQLEQITAKNWTI